MDLINSDMMAALENLNISAEDRKLLIDLLYNERINKNHEWTSDAIKYIKDQINAAETETETIK